MPSVAIAAVSINSWKPSYDEPVSVFIGGAAGVGAAMAADFAKLTDGMAHIIIIGRNRNAAEKILSSLAKPSVKSTSFKREFIQSDVSLMKNVEETASILRERLSKINFLVFSAGFASLRGRDETEEGIDKQLALRYYHRWKFIYELLPLLRMARDRGEDARVMSVLGANASFFVNPDDFGMKHSYNGLKVPLATGGYNDYMMEEFALREPGIAFTHIYPGFVNTNQYSYSHWFLKLFSFIIDPLLRLLLTAPEDCSKCMWYGLLAGEHGFFRRNQNGDDIGRSHYPGYPNLRKALWDHSLAVTHC